MVQFIKIYSLQILGSIELKENESAALKQASITLYLADQVFSSFYGNDQDNQFTAGLKKIHLERFEHLVDSMSAEEKAKLIDLAIVSPQEYQRILGGLVKDWAKDYLTKVG
jgi:hypothetical protein